MANIRSASRFATTAHIQHSMAGDSKRLERDGEPYAAPRAKPQFPAASGVSEPWNRLEPHWQPTHKDDSTHTDRYFKDGASNGKSREVPLYGGGVGRVVGSLRESELAAKGKA